MFVFSFGLYKMFKQNARLPLKVERFNLLNLNAPKFSIYFMHPSNKENNNWRKLVYFQPSMHFWENSQLSSCYWPSPNASCKGTCEKAAFTGFKFIDKFSIEILCNPRPTSKFCKHLKINDRKGSTDKCEIPRFPGRPCSFYIRYWTSFSASGIFACTN